MTYFIAGFLAPRASYLVGGLLGLIDGALLPIGLLLTSPPASDVLRIDALSGIGSYAVTGALFGGIAGWFAGWYRDFLRGMQGRGRSKTRQQGAGERAKRREERARGTQGAEAPDVLAQAPHTGVAHVADALGLRRAAGGRAISGAIRPGRRSR